jgi:hypothetical protein
VCSAGERESKNGAETNGHPPDHTHFVSPSCRTARTPSSGLVTQTSTKPYSGDVSRASAEGQEGDKRVVRTTDRAVDNNRR